VGVKAVRRMLMELTPGLNVINVLRTAFTLADPECTKNSYNFTVFLMLLGFVQVKAAQRMLMKLTPGFDETK